MLFRALRQLFKPTYLTRHLHRLRRRHLARPFVGTCHPTPPARRPVINHRVPKNPAMDRGKSPNLKPSLRSKPAKFRESLDSSFPSSLTLTSTHSSSLKHAFARKIATAPPPPKASWRLGEAGNSLAKAAKHAPAEVSDRHRTSFSSHSVIRCHRPTSAPVVIHVTRCPSRQASSACRYARRVIPSGRFHLKQRKLPLLLRQPIASHPLPVG